MAEKTTLSVIKADVGSIAGHLIVHPRLEETARASLKEAVSLGVIEDFHVTHAGDDLELIMTHRRGVDNPKVHEGFIEIFNCEELIGSVTNIGMNEEISVEDLANTIAGLLKIKISIKADEQRIRPENSEVERLRCDNTKMMKYTGWEPKYN